MKGKIEVTNSNNAVVFDWPATDPFGANQPTTNVIDFNIRYPGQYYDSETAYHYNYHRYYNPQTGKYLQADPIGLQGGYNLYNYVDNNSLTGIDPEGLWVQYAIAPIVGAGIGAAAGGVTGWLRGGAKGAANDAVRYGMQGAITGLAVTGAGALIGNVIGGGFITQVSANVIGSMGAELATQFAFDCKIDTFRVAAAGVYSAIFLAPVFKPYILNKQNVTSWAPEGISPDLNTSRWVMLGGKNRLNHSLAGVNGSKNFPYNNSVTSIVEGNKITYPSGWEAIKGTFGQRVIK